MSQIFSLLREIRERRLFQIFAAYAAIGWAVVQVVSNLVQHGVLPPVVYILTLIWYVGGLPSALMAGWFHGERGNQKAPKLEIFSVSVIALVCLGLSSAAVANSRAGRLAAEAAATGLRLNRLAVLYFEDVTRGKELQYLADGLTEELTSELQRVRSLDVVSTNGAVQFRGSDLSPDSIAKLLGVGTLVDGTVERVADRVRVNVRLVDGSGAEFQRASFERPAGEVFSLGDQLAQETSRLLREWLGDEIRLRELRHGTTSPVAWALYNRAEKARKDAEALNRHGDHAEVHRLFTHADSFLAEAERLDPAWPEPSTLRARLAYRRSRLEHDPHDAVPWVRTGVSHAQHALERSPNYAPALEVRGTLRYWHWLINVTPDAPAHEALLASARADLERAVELDPTLANAHQVLSHLYYREDPASAVLAARKAYEEDAYLEAANEILWRLTLGSYDLAQFTQAKRWCDEGATRFPADHRFVHCQLLLMTTHAAQADAERAWALLARQEHLVPPERREIERAKNLMWVSGVLAQAGLADSARVVLARARTMDHAVDPGGDLYLLEAHVRTLLGDAEQAVRLLTHYAASHPKYSFEHHWWWQGLRDRPEFQRLRSQH